MQNTRYLIHCSQLFTFSLKLKTFKLSNGFISLSILLHSISILNSTQFKTFLLNMNYLISNKDVRILFRESSYFLTFLGKVHGYLKSNTLWIRRKIINVLRSPFATSKSKEHLGSFSHTLMISLNSLSDILISLYLGQFKNNLSKHNTLKSKRKII